MYSYLAIVLHLAGLLSIKDDFIVCVDNQFGSQSCFAVASSQYGKVNNNLYF